MDSLFSFSFAVSPNRKLARSLFSLFRQVVAFRRSTGGGPKITLHHQCRHLNHSPRRWAAMSPQFAISFSYRGQAKVVQLMFREYGLWAKPLECAQTAAILFRQDSGVAQPTSFSSWRSCCVACSGGQR